MKILITTDPYTPVVSGVVVSVNNLKNYLEERGNEVKILTLSSIAKSYVDGDVTYIASLPADTLYEQARIALKYSSSYIQKLVDWCPDVVHSQTEFSTYFMARKIAHKVGAPLLHTYHTIYEDYTHYFIPSKKIGKTIVSNITKLLLKKTSIVIAPTEKVRDLLVEYGVKNEIVIMPTGIDTDKFMTVPESEEWVLEKKRELNISENNKVLLFVGRLGKEKGIDHILRYLKNEKSQNFVFVIVGGGPYKEQLEEIVTEYGLDGRVVFTGMISPDQIPLYYKLGDIFVSASTSETQGLTYIEAMSAGLPLLCKKDPCLKDVVQEGVSGWTFEGEKDFIEKLHLFARDKAYAESVKKNVISTANKFSAKTFAENAEKAYKEAIMTSHEI